MSQDSITLDIPAFKNTEKLPAGAAWAVAIAMVSEYHSRTNACAGSSDQVCTALPKGKQRK